MSSDIVEDLLWREHALCETELWATLCSVDELLATLCSVDACDETEGEEEGRICDGEDRNLNECGQMVLVLFYSEKQRVEHNLDGDSTGIWVYHRISILQNSYNNREGATINM